jgi:hypothetical protein
MSTSSSNESEHTWQGWTHAVYMHVLVPHLDTKDILSVALVSRTDCAWTRRKCRMWRWIRNKSHAWLNKARRAIEIRKDEIEIRNLAFMTATPQITFFEFRCSRFTNFGMENIASQTNEQHQQKQQQKHTKQLTRLAQRTNQRRHQRNKWR